MFNSIGPTELIIVLVIVLLIFGPKRLPGLGRQLGSGMREFKDSISGKDDKDDDEDDERGSADRRRGEAALAPPAAPGGTGGRPERPEGEPAPLEGDVVPERRS